MEERSNVKIICRVRPPSHGASLCISDVQCKSLKVDNSGYSSPAFEFDHVLGTSATQEQVYKFAAFNLVEGVLAGYDGALLCYGQTGSGKTYTLEGNLADSSEGGILPRAAVQIFDTASLLMDVVLSIRFVELYLEKVHDLLCIQRNVNRRPQPNLNIRALDSRGPMVQNCSEVKVTSCDQILELARFGASNRHVATTKMNHISSRSHSIFSITVKHVDADYGRRVSGTLHLVDLAGSERQTHSRAEGKTFDEARNINRSLSALGDVIVALTQVQRGQRDVSHVPYRNSKLTLLLREAFGRSSNSVLILHVSPEEEYKGETISTLRFGSCAMCVENNPRQNIKAALGCVGRKQKEKLHALGDRLSSLRSRLGDLSTDVSSAIDATFADAQEALINSQVVANECFEDDSLSRSSSQFGCFETCSDMTEDTLLNELQSNLDTMLSSLDQQLGEPSSAESSTLLEFALSESPTKEVSAVKKHGMLNEPQLNVDTMASSFDEQLGKSNMAVEQEAAAAESSTLFEFALSENSTKEASAVKKNHVHQEGMTDVAKVYTFPRQDERQHTVSLTEAELDNDAFFAQAEDCESQDVGSEIPAETSILSSSCEDIRGIPRKVQDLTPEDNSFRGSSVQIGTIDLTLEDEHAWSPPEKLARLQGEQKSAATLTLSHGGPDAQVHMSQDSHLEDIGAKLVKLRAKLSSITSSMDSLSLEHSPPKDKQHSPHLALVPSCGVPCSPGVASDPTSILVESEAATSSTTDVKTPLKQDGGKQKKTNSTKSFKVAEMMQAPMLARYVQSRGRGDSESAVGSSNDGPRGLWKVNSLENRMLCAKSRNTLGLKQSTKPQVSSSRVRRTSPVL